MPEISLQSIDYPQQSLTLFSSVRGGFSQAEGAGIRTVQDLLRVIQPLRIRLYEGHELRHRQRVGEGASFTVFRSRDWRHGKAVAVKQVKLPQGNSQQDVFQRQVSCVLKDIEIMNHPPLSQHMNVLSLLGYGWGLFNDSALPFLVTEFSSSGSYRQFLQQVRPSQQLSLNLCSDVASGLDALHLSGIAHGDVKLENVLIFETSNRGFQGEVQCVAKLSDFGHSCVLTSEQAHGAKQSYRGTIGYLAPELYNEALDAVNFRKCDIWALALLVWEAFLNGTRYREVPQVKALLSQFDTSSMNLDMQSVEDEQPILSSAEKPGHAYYLISRYLVDAALASIDEATRDGLAHMERMFVKGILKMCLRHDHRTRYEDVAKLPFIRRKPTTITPNEFVERSNEGDKWGFEPFMPENIGSIPEKAKVQMITDGEATANQPFLPANVAASAALYVAMAYAVGFGVEADMNQCRIWVSKSAQAGSPAARILIRLLSNSSSVRETLLMDLYAQWCNKDLEPLVKTCRFQAINAGKANSRSFSSCGDCNPLHYLCMYDKLSLQAHSLDEPTIQMKGSFGQHYQSVKDLDSIVKHYGDEYVTKRVSEVHYLREQLPISLSGDPLSFAVVLNCQDSVESLLRCHADPLQNFQDKELSLLSLCPLQHAVSCLNVQLFSLLWNACQQQYGAYRFFKLLFADGNGACLLVASLATRSILERTIFHGSNRMSAQLSMVRCLKEAVKNLYSHVCSNLEHAIQQWKNETHLISHVFSHATQSTLRLGDLEISSQLVDQTTWHEVPVPYDRLLRVSIMEAATEMACKGCFDIARSAEYLAFAKDVGKDLPPEPHIIKGMMDHHSKILFEQEIGNGIDLNCRLNNDQSPLHYMILTGFREIMGIQTLIDHGANINCTNAVGETPLHLAACLGLQQEVEVLLAAGANPLLSDVHDLTPLFGALISGSHECLTSILTALKAVSNQTTRAPARLNLISFGSLRRPRNQTGGTALHFASQRLDAVAIKLLLEHGAAVDMLDGLGNTPLHIVIQSKDSGISRVLSCVTLLLAAGARLDIQNNVGLTVVHVAARCWKDHDLEKILKLHPFRQAPALDLVDRDGRTILHYVAGIAADTSAEIVMNLGATTTIADNHGMTPLHICAKTSDRALSQRNADASRRLLVIAENLLKKGADLHCKDHSGFTAADYAVLNGSDKFFVFLMRTVVLTRGRTHISSRKALYEALSSAWNRGIDLKHWSIVKEIMHRWPRDSADLRLLEWPIGAQLFRYAVENADTTLLAAFWPLPEEPYQATEDGRGFRQSSVLFQQTERNVNASQRIRPPRQTPEDIYQMSCRGLPRTLDDIKFALGLRVPRGNEAWHDNLRRTFESLVKELFSVDPKVNPLHQTYAYMASWDEELVSAYFTPFYSKKARMFLQAWVVPINEAKLSAA